MGLSAKATASDRYAVWFPALEGLLFRQEMEIRHRIDAGRAASVLQITGLLSWENRQAMHDLQRQAYEDVPLPAVLVGGFWYTARVTSVDADRNDGGRDGAMGDLRVNLEFALFPTFDPPTHPVITLRRRIGRRLK